MSTYYNPGKPKANSYEDCPKEAVAYLQYAESIRGLSPRTVNAYYVDLRVFFKYLVHRRGLAPADKPLDAIDISALDIGFIREISKSEVYDYLYYATRERGNSAAARARKLSSIKGFFRYLTSKTGQLQNNPTDDIEMPAQKKRLPKYLSLDESKELLKSVGSDFPERDYLALTLFLNCGMRLSELVGLNLQDIKNDTLRLVGKGNKERMVYLNPACLTAYAQMAAKRAKIEHIKDANAMFISRRTGKRLSARRVQQIVTGCLQLAGLDGKGFSVHKLRHTAATLMYQYGNVDMLVLKEVLGHANVSTTQIYTHLDAAQLKKAAAASPLSSVANEVNTESAGKQGYEDGLDVENTENDAGENHIGETDHQAH